MDAGHVLEDEVEAVGVARAALARLVFHPHDGQRLDELHAPEHMAVHRTRTLVPRSSCTATDGSCELPVQQSQYTLPIVLGIAAPILAAAVAFFFLNRRHRRKQKAEDLNDPHKSLDFGLGEVARGGVLGRKGTGDSGLGGINMDEKPNPRGRQLSMDLISPYLLPPEVQQSRESLHSLSRTIHQQEDPYRNISQFVADTSRPGTPTRPRHDGSSIYTGSSSAPSRMRDNYTTELLPNAADMPRSPSALSSQLAFVPPPRLNSLPQSSAPASSPDAFTNTLPQIPKSPFDLSSTPIQMPEPVAQTPRKNPALAVPGGLPSNLHPMPSPAAHRPDSDLELSRSPPQLGTFNFSDDTTPSIQHNNDYSGPFMDHMDFDEPPPPPPQKAPERLVFPFQNNTELTIPVNNQSPPAGKSLPANPRPERKQSLPVAHLVEQKQLPQPEPQQAWLEEESDYGDGFKVTPPSPGRDHARLSNRYSIDAPPEEFVNAGLGATEFDARRLSMGFRPLPPNEVTETDDPEIRANRIRSFYKEYFDDSKPAPQGQYYEEYDANYSNHGGYDHSQYSHGDYDDRNYYDDGAYYNPDQNNFVLPYAQPITRRAMTPPPRSHRFTGHGPPRHGSMSGMSLSGMSSSGRSMGGGPGPSRFNPGPRPYSSASGRLPQGRGRQGKPAPPPGPLNTLPTPSKLRDDTFALMSAIEFAPPLSYKERQRGRSESPLGERRPYSPSVPAFKPLASAYDELAQMPSPHLLRSSGTFTGLDFAPPRKFKDADNMSDAGSIRGSIRSNRSGVSAMHSEAIRKGAYRVSRLPTDQVFTRDNMTSMLKPQWGMRQGV